MNPKISSLGGGHPSHLTESRVRFTDARRKMDQIKATGAKMLVVPCHSCHSQFNQIKKEYGMADLEIKYLWELVADCLIP